MTGRATNENDGAVRARGGDQYRTHNGTSFDPATESFAGWVLRVVEGLARYRADRVREAQLHDDQGARERALAEIAQTTDSVERALIEGARWQVTRDVVADAFERAAKRSAT